jgi:UDP-glucose 4-epimerase
VSLDIRDEKAFDDVFSKHPDIDSVIHFAALKVRPVAGNGDHFVGMHLDHSSQS